MLCVGMASNTSVLPRLFVPSAKGDLSRRFPYLLRRKPRCLSPPCSAPDPQSAAEFFFTQRHIRTLVRNTIGDFLHRRFYAGKTTNSAIQCERVKTAKAYMATSGVPALIWPPIITGATKEP